MGDALADAFRMEIPCTPDVAARLASLARGRLTGLGGGPEDTDEDILVRLRDPRTFGVLAEAAIQTPSLGPAVRQAVLEHVFDLLPLPRSEGEVFEVDTRAPPRLLALAADLAASGGLTVLHVMHLVYAVFLDRSLVENVPRSTRAALYQAVLAEMDASESLRLLYAGLHLASVPEPEAVAEFKRTLRSPSLPSSLRRGLASAAATEDGGRSLLATMARREGLLPADLADEQAPAVLANIPRLPGKLAAPGRRYLERRPAA